MNLVVRCLVKIPSFWSIEFKDVQLETACTPVLLKLSCHAFKPELLDFAQKSADGYMMATIPPNISCLFLPLSN
jgi:hypothetical protein